MQQDSRLRFSRNLFWFCLAFFLTLATLPAFATTPTKPPEQTPSPTQAQTQNQNQTQSAASQSESSVSSNGLSASYASDTDTIAVGLANPTTAAPVFTKCHESRGGKHVIAGSWGARVTIDHDCQAFEQCMALARTYIEVGERDLAIAQLRECGGQPVPEVQTFSLEGESEQVCDREILDRSVEACLTK